MTASPAVQSESEGRPASDVPSEPPLSERAASTRSVALPDGRRLSLECWPGDGAPLVLLHGPMDCGLGWKQPSGESWRARA